MAFPSTPIIDSFGRADSPLDSSLACSNGINSWFQGAIFGGATTGGQILSNRVTNTGGGVLCGTFIAGTNYGPDVEVYQSYSVVPTSYAYVACRVTSENTANPSLYMFIWLAGIGWRLRTYGPFATLASDNANPLTAGDKIGISAVGTTITGWHFTGGAWVSRLSVTDTTFSGSGKIGWELMDNTARAFDFGGGSTAPVIPAVPLLVEPSLAHSRRTSW